MDSKLRIEGEIEYESLFFHYISSGEYKFLVNAEHPYRTVILDAKNKSIAEIEASGEAMLHGKTLYDRSKTSLNEIDLSDIIKSSKLNK